MNNIKELAERLDNSSHIYICGYSGSGKSTIAKKIAQILNRGIVHLDEDLRWWDMIAADPDHKHLIPGTFEHTAAWTLARQISFDKIRYLTKPHVVEGVQLYGVQPHHLHGSKLLLTTPDDTIVEWRASRTSHTEIGTNAAGGEDLSRKLIEADRDFNEVWLSDPLVIKLNPLVMDIS